MCLWWPTHLCSKHLWHHTPAAGLGVLAAQPSCCTLCGGAWLSSPTAAAAAAATAAAAHSD